VFILKKIYSSRNSGPISIKLGTNHPWEKGIQIGPVPFRRGDSKKKFRNFAKSLKNVLDEKLPLGQNMSYSHESFLT
jgi:hypothetical protein